MKNYIWRLAVVKNDYKCVECQNEVGDAAGAINKDCISIPKVGLIKCPKCKTVVAYFKDTEGNE